MSWRQRFEVAFAGTAAVIGVIIVHGRVYEYGEDTIVKSADSVVMHSRLPTQLRYCQHRVYLYLDVFMNNAQPFSGTILARRVRMIETA